MRERIAILIFILSYTTSVSGQNWQVYPYSPPNTVLSFPADDGKHTSASTTTEWWYTNLHVIGSAPDYKVYDVMLAYFNKPISMRIFNMALPATGVFHTNVINLQAPSALSVKTGHWEFTYTVPSLSVHDTSKWTFPTDGIPYRYSFHTENPGDKDGLDVILTSNRPPLNVGGDGFIPIGSNGDSSFYYSYTNMKVEGTIKFGGTTEVITSGIAWIDRQWGPFTVGYNPNNLYEWFSMQLDTPGIKWGSPHSPSEFNIWQIYSDTNDVPDHPASRLLSAMYADNSQDTTSGFIYERTSYWYDQAYKEYYSSGWRLINPKRNITLDMTPTTPNQVVNVTLFKFWEGATKVKGVVQNQDFEGIGFAELVAKHTYEIKTPSAPEGLHVSGFTDHNTIRWNASLQGTYPVEGYRVFRSSSGNGFWKYLATTSQLQYDDYSANGNSAFYYTVTSFDNQSATSASVYANPVSLGIHDVPSADNSASIYPNPARDKITLDNAGKQFQELTLYNTAGQLVLQKKLNKGLNEVDLQKLKKGEYIIRLKGSSGTVHQKLILE